MDMLSYFLGRLAEGGLSGADGTSYKSITYNDDGTITLIDTNDIEHILMHEYEDDRLVSMSYDDKVIELTYEDDALVGIGKAVVDFSNVEDNDVKLLDNTVTFKVDGETYEIVSVKDGNTVSSPTEPISEDGVFKCWQDESSNRIVFPYTPLTDIEFVAAFQSALIADLYSHFKLSQETYPYVFIVVMADGNTHLVFAGGYTHDATNLDVTTVKRGYTNKAISTFDDILAVVEHTKANITSLTSSGTYGFGAIGKNHNIYTNADMPLTSAQVHKLI